MKKASQTSVALDPHSLSSRTARTFQARSVLEGLRSANSERRAVGYAVCTGTGTLYVPDARNCPSAHHLPPLRGLVRARAVRSSGHSFRCGKRGAVDGSTARTRSATAALTHALGSTARVALTSDQAAAGQAAARAAVALLKRCCQQSSTTSRDRRAHGALLRHPSVQLVHEPRLQLDERVRLLPPVHGAAGVQVTLQAHEVDVLFEPAGALRRWA